MIKLVKKAIHTLIINDDDEYSGYLVTLIALDITMLVLLLIFSIAFLTDAFTRDTPLYIFTHTHSNICIAIMVANIIGIFFGALALAKSGSENYNVDSEGRILAIYACISFILSGAFLVSLPFLIVGYICIYTGIGIDRIFGFIMGTGQKKPVKTTLQKYDEFLDIERNRSDKKCVW